MWSWTTPFTSLGLSFLISKMGVYSLVVLWSIHCVPGTILGSGVTSLNKTAEMLSQSSHSHVCKVRGTKTNKQVNELDHVQNMAKSIKKMTAEEAAGSFVE